MNNKARSIIGLIVTVLYVLNCGVQAVALIIMSDPKEMIYGLFGKDGETAAILLLVLIIGVVIWIVAVVISAIESLAALIGRVAGLILSPIGLVASVVYMCFNMVTLGMAVEIGNDMIIGGTLLFEIATGFMCMLSLANLIYVLTEFCIYKSREVDKRIKRD